MKDGQILKVNLWKVYEPDAKGLRVRIEGLVFTAMIESAGLQFAWQQAVGTQQLAWFGADELNNLILYIFDRVEDVAAKYFEHADAVEAFEQQKENERDDL